MLLVEKFRLLKETSTADNKTLLQAIDELCFTTYERFKKFLQRANVDYVSVNTWTQLLRPFAKKCHPLGFLMHRLDSSAVQLIGAIVLSELLRRICVCMKSKQEKDTSVPYFCQGTCFGNVFMVH